MGKIFPKIFIILLVTISFSNSEFFRKRRVFENVGLKYFRQVSHPSYYSIRGKVPFEMARNSNQHDLDLEGDLHLPLGKFEKELVGSFLLFSVLALSWSYWVMTASRIGRLLNRFPGPTTLPFFGNAYLFMGRPADLLNKMHFYVEKYGGRSFRIWNLHHPYVILLDPDEIEIILSSHTHIQKGEDYEKLRYMNGDGLVTSAGHVWREDRKLLNPSFKYQRFPAFLHSFNKNTKTLVAVLKEMFQTGREVKDIHPAVCRCTMDTVFEGVLGTTFNIQENYETEETADILYKATKALLESYRTRTLKPWLCLPVVRHLSGFAKMERFIKTSFTKMMTKVIEERKLIHASLKTDTTNTAFVDVLLGTRSNQNLVDHAFTIFAAGFETNATATVFVLFLLALYPEVQEKVVEEIDMVFGDGPIETTTKTISELKYLEMCVLETMRLFPPAPIMARNLEEDVPLPSGLTLPKGTDVAIFTYEIHTDPKVYPDPLTFDPSRFLPENVKKRPPYSYIPFSKGPRSCIGQKYAMLQMKTVLVHVLREFKVTTQMRREDIQIVYGSIIEIDRDITLTLTQRTNSGKLEETEINNNL